MSVTVKSIADAMKLSYKSKKPFVLFTGAGCSLSAGMPSANDLIREINSKKAYKHLVIGLSNDEKKDYGECMSKLSPIERRKLVQGYIDKSEINWAHIALASMLQAGYISRVVTFNFDNILTRACGLLGFYPAIYDFTTSSPELHAMIVEPAIVHLHGQGSGFTLLNTKDETTPQAKNLLSFTKDVLLDKNSLFIGYSGLADAFFNALYKTYKGFNHLYWAAYEAEPLPHLKDFLDSHKNQTHFIGEQDADLFLIGLANELGCFPPKLFENPYLHLLKTLDNVQSFPVELHDTHMNLMPEVKKHLGTASKKAGEIISLKIENLIIRNKYQEVINYYEFGNGMLFTDEDKKNIIRAYLIQGSITCLRNEGDVSVFSFFEKAIAVNKYSEEAYNKWAEILFFRYGDGKSKFFWIGIDRYLASLDKAIFPIGLSIIGWLFCQLSVSNQDPVLLEKGINFHKKAIKLGENDYRVVLSMARALLIQARLLRKKEIFHEVIYLYNKLFNINSKDHSHLSNKGLALLQLAELSSTEEKIEVFKEAKVTLVEAEFLNPDDVYNLGCYYSLTNQSDLCKEKLLRCEQAGTLPKPHTKKYLMEDTDLDNVRHLDWFQELLARLPD